MFGEGKATKKRFHFFGLFDPWSCNLVSGWLNSWWPSAIVSKASTDSRGFQQSRGLRTALILNHTTTVLRSYLYVNTSDIERRLHQQLLRIHLTEITANKISLNSGIEKEDWRNPLWNIL